MHWAAIRTTLFFSWHFIERFLICDPQGDAEQSIFGMQVPNGPLKMGTTLPAWGMESHPLQPEWCGNHLALITEQSHELSLTADSLDSPFLWKNGDITPILTLSTGRAWTNDAHNQEIFGVSSRLMPGLLTQQF